jgi:hypothetical protein
MRYKITNTDTNKEYYRKKLPRKMPKGIKNGAIFEVNETFKMIGIVTDGEKTIFTTIRT